MEENKKEEKIKIQKYGFFKRVWNSITKIEKYPEMSALGLKKAIGYIFRLVAILAVILSLGTIYQTYQIAEEGKLYLENEFPEFTYKDGMLDINSENKLIISAEDSYIGETIIDTKTEDQEVINQYVNDIGNNGVVILKDKAIVKNITIAGTVNYDYDQMLNQFGITEFEKQDLINYINSSQMLNFYFSIFLTIFVYSLVMYILTVLSNAIFLSVFGYLVTFVARIRMRFVALFNMAIYSLTLSIILNMIYIAVNIFITFNMQYFQVMYITVASIYLIASIFLLKSECIKRQAEVMKIVEEQEKIKQELEQQKEEEEVKKEKEEQKKKDKKEEKEKTDGEPEGSKA